MIEQVMSERDLIQKFTQAKEAKEAAEAVLATAEADYQYYEFLILERCEALGTSKTGEYTDLGHVTVMKPAIYANCAQEVQAKLFENIRAMGREDLIKETIHPSALSGFVGECIDEVMSNRDLTPGQREERLKILRTVSYHLRPKARLYSPKKNKGKKVTEEA